MVQYSLAMLSAIVVIGSVIADVLVYALDPRVRKT